MAERFPQSLSRERLAMAYLASWRPCQPSRKCRICVQSTMGQSMGTYWNRTCIKASGTSSMSFVRTVSDHIPRPVATVLVLRGSLKVATHIISGVSHARVRVMNDSNGTPVKIATPGMAVTVSGWKTLPSAGDDVLQGSEPDIKKAIANRQRKAEIEASLSDTEAINSSRR